MINFRDRQHALIWLVPLLLGLGMMCQPVARATGPHALHAIVCVHHEVDQDERKRNEASASRALHRLELASITRRDCMPLPRRVDACGLPRPPPVA